MLALALALLLLATASEQRPILTVQKANGKTYDDLPPLRLNADGTFEVTIFDDLHFGENAWDKWGPQQDIHSIRVMQTVLDAESPNLVVLNGDLITGENVFRANGTEYVDRIVQPLQRRGLSWASTYGNHDNDVNLAAAEIYARERRFRACRTRSMVAGPNAGVSNYYLLVYKNRVDDEQGSKHGGTTDQRQKNVVDDDDDDDDSPVLILWFFDSRGGNYPSTNPHQPASLPWYWSWWWPWASSRLTKRPQPDWVDASVATWFQRTNAHLQAQHGHDIPSLAFVHIPPTAFLSVQQQKPADDDDDAHHHPGINDEVPLNNQGSGWCADARLRDHDCESTPAAGAAAGAGHDGPFVRALANTSGLAAVFSGHDHGNTWCKPWQPQQLQQQQSSTSTSTSTSTRAKAVHLCFGQHSGYGGYGNWIRGARQVRVNLTTDDVHSLARKTAVAPPQVETWIRLETGKVVARVGLNSTYGHDVYPATPNDKTYCPDC